MATNRSAADNRRDPGTRPLRWALVLFASLLLHLTIFHWANGRIGLPSWEDRPEPVMTAALLPPPAKKMIVPPHRPAIAPRPRAKPKPRPKPVSPPPAAQVTPALPQIPDIPPADIETPSDDASSQAIAAAAASVTPAAQPPSGTRFDPPPSAELEYDVFALREQQKWYGSGTFLWQAADGRYSVTGEAGVTFFFRITALNFRSEGTIASFGIAPARYTEQPFHKPMTQTIFQQDGSRGRISFSASQASYPYHGGEQDRASIIWQLAGIGRGDPAQFAPGSHIDIFVAGTRDAETWQMQVIGLEPIETGYGKMSAWHVMRAARAGSHEQKIDIWLAPQHQWYPVKVRYSYDNGDYLDLSLSDLTPSMSQSAPPMPAQ